MTSEDFKLVRSLFHQAFELNEPDRSSFLDRECAGRAKLRTEVEGLLRAQQRAQTRLDPNDSSIAQQLLAPRAAGPGIDPARIGPYEIVKRIGQGGMGIVYLARQGHPRREVALKVLRHGLALDHGTSGRRRFEREIRLLGQLQHPGIAQIFEAGIADLDAGAGGLPYFAMEYIHGHPLTEYAAKNELSVRARLELITLVADAVHHAHSKGILHRDLKPSNILVTDAALPKVLDFGVARALDQDAQQTLQTESGVLVGTIAYMSPEQVAGAPDAVDTRADVYSLGVMLFEILTGELPYDIRGKQIAEAARITRDTEPRLLNETPCTGDPARRDFDRDIEAIAAKALEKDPSRRYQSADQFGEDLRRYLRHEAVMAHPQTRWYQFRKFARRNRSALAAALGMLVLLTGGIIGTSIGMLRAYSARDAERQQRQRAELNERKARGERDRAQAFASFMKDTLSGIVPSIAAGRDTNLLREMMDGAAQQIQEGRLKDIPEAEIDLRVTIAEMYRRIGAFAQAEEMLAPAERLAQSLGGSKEARQSLSTVLITSADLLIDTGRPAEAEKVARLALDLNVRDLGSDSTELRWSLARIAAACQDLGRSDEAERLYQQALDLGRRVHSGDSREMAYLLQGLARVTFFTGRYTQAEPLFQEALDIRRRLAKRDRLPVAESLEGLAAVRQVLGHAEDAEPLQREALDVRRRVYHGDHPELARSLSNVAGVLHTQGKLEQAEEMFQQALEMDRRLFPGDHPTKAQALHSLAQVHQAMNRASSAEGFFREALEIDRRQYAQPHPHTALVLHHLAELLRSDGRLDEAEPLAREAFDLYCRNPKWTQYEAGHATMIIVAILDDMNRTADSIDVQRRALALLRQQVGPGDERLAAGLMQLGRALITTGAIQDTQEAEPLLREALNICHRIFPGDHVSSVECATNLAMCLSKKAGDVPGSAESSESLEVAALAAEMASRILPENHPQRVEAEHVLKDLKARSTRD